MTTATALRPTTHTGAWQPTEAHNDEGALMAAYQQGREIALESLIRRYEPLVRRTCRRFFLPGGTSEDLFQEGLIGVYQALSTWSARRGMSISDYVGLSIRNQVVRAVRMATRQKHTPLSKSVSLDAEAQTTVPRTTSPGPEAEVLGELAVEDWRALMIMHLSELERTVLQLKSQEVDTDEVAQRLAVPRKQVDNALFRARKKLSTAAAAADLAETVLRPLARKAA